MKTHLSELFQKPDIVLEQEPNVVQLINSRAGAVDPQAKGKAGELFRVHVGRAQHVRMHHAGTAQLDPSRAFANAAAFAATVKATVIDFGARFREWKVRRSKTSSRFRPEQAMHKLSQRALQMSHGDSAIHAESFNLKEHRIVRGIGRVAPKDSSGRDHSYRSAASLHRMNLHSRSLRTQGKPVSGVEGVLRIAGRVPFRNI